MIKFAPKDYHIEKCTLDTALLYCFSLNINSEIRWRLPSRQESKRFQSIGIWLDEDVDFIHTLLWKCVTVREI